MAAHTKWTKWSTLLSPVRNTGDHTNTWSMLLLTTSRPRGLSDGKHFWCRPVTRDHLKLGLCSHLQLRLKLKKKRERVCAICKNQLCGQDEYISCPIQITWVEIKFWQCSALGGGSTREWPLVTTEIFCPFPLNRWPHQSPCPALLSIYNNNQMSVYPVSLYRFSLWIQSLISKVIKGGQISLRYYNIPSSPTFM